MFAEHLRNTDPIIVMNCRPCNMGTSADDEYIRMAMILESGAELHPDSLANIDPLIRGLRKTDKALTLASIRRRLVEVRKLDVESLKVIDSQMAFYPDERRLFRIIEKWIRCLYFVEFGNILPVTWGARVVLFSDVSQNSEFVGMASHLQKVPLRRVGRNVLQYRGFRVKENRLASLWELTFYKRFRFVGWTLPDDIIRESRARCDALRKKHPRRQSPWLLNKLVLPVIMDVQPEPKYPSLYSNFDPAGLQSASSPFDLSELARQFSQEKKHFTPE